MDSGLEHRISHRLATLPAGLREHIYRVQELALELAQHHNIDENRVKLGALAHDLARSMKGDQLLQKARELQIPIDPVEAHEPILLHGPVAAELLRREVGLEDQQVYEAVYWHSTAHKGISPVAQVIFLADKLDPQKAHRYPFLPELKELAIKSLDNATLDFLSRQLESLIHEGSTLHPASVEARNQFLLQAK